MDELHTRWQSLGRMSNLYLVNDDLRWETTDTKNIGFDFGLSTIS